MGQLLVIFVNTLLPVFAIVAVGAFAGPRLGLEARTLSRSAYYAFIPAFVFVTLAGAKIPAGLAAQMSAYTIVVHLLCALIAWLVARTLRRPPQIVAAYVLVAVFGNVGNFGLPIVQFAFGREALEASTVYFLAILTVSFVVSVAAANHRHGFSVRAALAVLKTPALLAIPPALLVNAAQVALPLPLARGLQLLADAMIPVMLVGLGVQLAGTGWPRFNADTLAASLVRLVVGPVLAVLLAAPFGVHGLERDVGVLQAAMPTAVLAAIIAVENDVVPDFVMGGVMLSTLLSFVTLAVVIALT